MWRDLGFGHQPDVEGPSSEADSANLTKEEDRKLPAFLNRISPRAAGVQVGIEPGVDTQ